MVQNKSHHEILWTLLCQCRLTELPNNIPLSLLKQHEKHYLESNTYIKNASPYI